MQQYIYAILCHLCTCGQSHGVLALLIESVCLPFQCFKARKSRTPPPVEKHEKWIFKIVKMIRLISARSNICTLILPKQRSEVRACLFPTLSFSDLYLHAETPNFLTKSIKVLGKAQRVHRKKDKKGINYMLTFWSHLPAQPMHQRPSSNHFSSKRNEEFAAFHNPTVVTNLLHSLGCDDMIPYHSHM